MKIIIWCAIAILLALPNLSAGQNFWKPAGTVPDNVTAICANAATGKIIAGTMNGIYITSDTGGNWIKAASLANSGITSLVAFSSGILLVGTSSGLFIGPDSGSWNSTTITEPVTSISSNGIVGTQDGNIYTPNGGFTNWKKTAATGGVVRSISAIVYPAIVAACNVSTIWLSLDSGVTWNSIPAPTASLFNSIECSFVYPQDFTLFVATSSGGVLASRDTGNTWIDRNAGIKDLRSVSLLEFTLATQSGVFHLPYDSLKSGGWVDWTAGITGTNSITAFGMDTIGNFHLALDGGRIFTQWINRGFQHVKNTKSNLDFFITNKGILFNNNTTAGLQWPRGSNDSYVFGGGLWFATKKYLPLSPEAKQGWSEAGVVPHANAFAANSVSRRILGIDSNFTATYSILYSRSETSYLWDTTRLPAKAKLPLIVALPNGKDLIWNTAHAYLGSDMGPFDSVALGGKTIATASSEGVIASFASPYTIFVPNADWSVWKARSFTPNARPKLISSVKHGAVILVLTVSGTISLSADSGNTWLPISAPPSGVNSIVGLALADDASVFAATTSGSIFWSANQGNSWSHFDDGIAGSMIKSLKSANGQDFAVLTDLGIFQLNYNNPNGWVLKTSGISWANHLKRIDIDATGKLHAMDSSGQVWTEWTSDALKPGMLELCELGYNPNSGVGWFTQGETAAPNDGADPIWKYYPYLGTSFNTATGSPVIHDAFTPIYRWPVWKTDAASGKAGENFNFGSRMPSVKTRDSLASLNEKPVFISEEDIINSYSDNDISANPEFKPGAGYPFGLNIQESIYTWGFGRYRDIIYVRYHVTNASKDTLKECFLAPAIDPDLGIGGSAAANDMNSAIDNTDKLIVSRALGSDPAYQDFVNNPELLNMGYQFSSPESGKEYGMIGLALVETPVVVNNEIIDNSDSLRLGGYGPNSLYRQNRLALSSFRSWTISNDPPTSNGRYEFLSGRRKDHDPSIIADKRVLLSCGPFDLIPRASVTTTLAIGIAHPSTTVRSNNLDSLIRLMAFAHRFFATPVVNSGDPNSVTIHHFEDLPFIADVKQKPSPSGFDLETYPNPCSSVSVVHFTLAEGSKVQIKLFDEIGSEVLAIPEKYFPKGEQNVALDMRDICSGMYSCMLTANGAKKMVKIVVVK